MKTKLAKKSKQNSEFKIGSWGPIWSSVDNLLRWSMMITMLLFLGVLLCNFFDISIPKFQTTNSTEKPSPSPKPSSQAPFLFIDEFQSGRWEIGKADWDFGVQQFPSRPTESQLTALPEESRSVDQLFDNDVFIDLFTSLSATKSKSQGMTTWMAKYGDTELVMLSKRIGEQEIVQSIRACYPDASGFTMLVGTPAGPIPEKTSKVLLPLCEGASQLACRRSENGIITSSIIDYSPKNVDIVGFWKDNSWDVRKTSEYHEINARYECHKNGIDVAATFMSDEQGKYKILSVRIPDASSRPPSMN